MTMRRVLLLLLATALTTGMAGSAELQPLPAVSSDAVPEEMRAQLEEQVLLVQGLLGEPDSDPLELAEAFGSLGKTFNFLDLTGVARVAWSNAAAIAPEDPRWHYYLGVLDRLEGRLPEAIERLERVVELRPDNLPALIRLGRTHLVSGEPDKAAEYFGAVLELEPGSSAALYGLGRTAAAAGRTDEALELLQEALVGQPEGSVVHYDLGMVYRRQGELELAGQQLARNRGVAVTFPDPWAAQLIPGAPSAHFHVWVALDALRAGDLTSAVEDLERARDLEPASPWIRYNLARAYERGGNTAQAREELKVALALDSDYRDAHFGLAQILAASGDFEAAVRHFERAREIDPLDRAAHLELAVALSRLDQTARALSEISALIEDAPNYAPARLARATLLAQMGRVAEAGAAAEEILGADASPAERAEAHLLLARLHQGSGSGEAERHYRQALDLDPTSEGAGLSLAMLLGRQGRFADAAVEFNRLVAANPDNADYRIGQTMALLLGQDYDSAAAALESAHADLPGRDEVSLLLARFLATCPDDALRSGERALQLAMGGPGSPQTLDRVETLAMALAELGRFEEAIGIQRQVVAQLTENGLPVEQSRRYLTSYEAGRPIRAPWLGGG